jgi:hypothetical protein
LFFSFSFFLDRLLEYPQGDRDRARIEKEKKLIEIEEKWLLCEQSICWVTNTRNRFNLKTLKEKKKRQTKKLKRGSF